MQTKSGDLTGRRFPASLALVLAVVGFLLVIVGTATTVATQKQEPRRQALINEIIQRRRDVDDLDKAVAELRAQMAATQNELAKSSGVQRDRNRTNEGLALEAGTTAVKGDGVTVKLSDAPRQPGDEAAFTASRIQDSDIQLVVNALFASGAEAVSVNDNRVVAVSPIRAAGGTIVVNYRPVNSPYRIDAIGVNRDQFENSEIVAHFGQWKKKFNLGFSVDKRKDISIPGYSGRVGIDVAKSEVKP